ncbi:radical SAM protein [Methanococcoides burtonii]|uniref:Radical SAM family protein n=1 Tax=Methanococcoides burtonii (strain DSM 6242 / NBRC 107633 / OCM 468 / ACE-M) TaxID=259564 RepID=Q12ZR0_METBU|nr:radical SAM protein [Methanococcoides burtonii]ABE51066.1 Radical SAM family protein [Methanococcoides burtonii DSM 6242]
MKEMIQTDKGSFYNFLTEGCRLCQQGAKMVLFITGICDRGCFYCPLSEDRKRDTVYANEKAVETDEDVLCEAHTMDALGTGITGGEPLLKKEKVIHYIELLKAEFGKAHHIHLYTSIAPSKETLEALASAGLDEIRFHPPQNMWHVLKGSAYEKAVKDAKYLGIEVGFELPSIKGVLELKDIINEMGCFLNLNELEFSDNNAMELTGRGFMLKNDISNAVEGSETFAREIAQYLPKMHFCSSRYKDAGQLRERLIRTSKQTARPFDEITEDGTLLYGSIEASDIEELVSFLNEIGVPEKMFAIKERAIELPGWFAEENAQELKEFGFVPSIIERYPFKDGLVVEVIPL